MLTAKITNTQLTANPPEVGTLVKQGNLQHHTPLLQSSSVILQWHGSQLWDLPPSGPFTSH